MALGGGTEIALLVHMNEPWDHFGAKGSGKGDGQRQRCHNPLEGSRRQSKLLRFSASFAPTAADDHQRPHCVGFRAVLTCAEDNESPIRLTWYRQHKLRQPCHGLMAAP